MSEFIPCPAGLSGRIRPLQGRGELILANRKLARSGAQVAQLLRACWTETLDPGPYAFAGEIINWDDVLQGDRFYALLQIRALTYGAEYAFKVQCVEDACRARFEWELSLNDLSVRPLTPELRDAFLAGNRFETTLPDSGRRVWFRLLTGREERRLPKLRRQAPNQMLASLLALRVVEVEDVEDRRKRAYLDDLSMRDADALLDAFDAVDCGVETTIEVECPECFGLQDVELPFERTFLMPGRGREQRRRDRTSSGL